MNKNIKRDKNSYVVKNEISVFYKIRDFFLTLLLWGLWIYIFYPLIALILYNYFDKNIFYDSSQEEIRLLGKSLKTFLTSSGIIIITLIISFTGWGFYNKKKYEFHKNKRRKQPQPVSSEIIAASLQINQAAIDKSKEAKYVQIYHTVETPNTKENLFKSIDDLNTTCVNLYFSDNWDRIRESSNFGYTHNQTEEKIKRNKFNLQNRG